MGRATKWAAATLKAKFHLFDREWAEAKAECDIVINQSPHRLLDDYAAVFDQSDPANQYNDELIFVIDFEQNLSDGPLSTAEQTITIPELGTNLLIGTVIRLSMVETFQRVDFFQTQVLQPLNQDMTGFGWAVPLTGVFLA